MAFRTEPPTEVRHLLVCDTNDDDFIELQLGGWHGKPCVLLSIPERMGGNAIYCSVRDLEALTKKARELVVKASS